MNCPKCGKRMEIYLTEKGFTFIKPKDQIKYDKSPSDYFDEIRKREKNRLKELNTMETKEKLTLVKKYLDTGRVETKDSLSLGIDPWDFPNYSELYVKRLALIVEELIYNI